MINVNTSCITRLWIENIETARLPEIKKLSKNHKHQSTIYTFTRNLEIKQKSQTQAHPFTITFQMDKYRLKTGLRDTQEHGHRANKVRRTGKQQTN